MRKTLLQATAALALLAYSVPAHAADPAQAMKDLETHILVTGAHGEQASSIASVSLTPEELQKIKDMHATAAIVMHYGGNDWSRAQVEALKAKFTDMGIRVIAVTDAGFKAEKQVSDVETVMAQKPSVIVAAPVDPRRHRVRVQGGGRRGDQDRVHEPVAQRHGRG